MDMATFIQTTKDMGCRANQVLTLEEGVNPQGPDHQQFWTVLGGQASYQREERTAGLKCLHDFSFRIKFLFQLNL